MHTLVCLDTSLTRKKVNKKKKKIKKNQKNQKKSKNLLCSLFSIQLFFSAFPSFFFLYYHSFFLINSSCFFFYSFFPFFSFFSLSLLLFISCSLHSLRPVCSPSHCHPLIYFYFFFIHQFRMFRTCPFA